MDREPAGLAGGDTATRIVVVEENGTAWHEHSSWSGEVLLRWGRVRCADGRERQALALGRPLAEGVIEACQPWFAASSGWEPLVYLGDGPQGGVALYESPPGVSLGQVLARRSAPLAERLALQLIADLAHHLAAVDYRHGGLHPGALRLGTDKQVRLALALPPALVGLVSPNSWPRDLVACAAPERLEGAPPSVAGDGWSLAACAYALLTRLPLARATKLEHLRLEVARGTIPDLDRELEQCTKATRDLFHDLLRPDPAERPGDWPAIAAAINQARCGKESARTAESSARLASVGGGKQPIRTRSGLIDAAALRRHLDGDETALKPAAMDFDEAALEKLSRMIQIARDGMRAWIALAPGASFPRPVLERLLDHAGIVHGRDDRGLQAATRAGPKAQKVVLAHGSEPHPGRPGTTVRGEAVTGLAALVEIEVDEARLEAVAHTPPGEPVPAAILKAALAAAGLARGLESQAIEGLIRLGSEQGRTVVARGRPVKPARSGAWRLAVPAKGDQRVSSGDHIATWVAEDRGEPGWTLDGQALAPERPESTSPARLAGAATDLTRFEGETVLLAAAGGAVRQDPDGTVMVVPVREIKGDIAPGETVETEEKLVVRGSVGAGATVKAAGGLVVIGQVDDATIEVGGDCLLDGPVAAGNSAITVAGTLSLTVAERRQVRCRRLEVRERLVDCTAIVAESTDLAWVCGGQVICAGSVRVDNAGHQDGRETILWAGHDLEKALAHDLAVLHQANLHSERSRLLTERKRLVGLAEDLHFKDYMYTVGGWMRKEYLDNLRQRLEQVAIHGSEVEAGIDSARQAYVATGAKAEELAVDTDNLDASVTVAKTAHRGVSLRIADHPPRNLAQAETKVYYKV